MVGVVAGHGSVRRTPAGSRSAAASAWVKAKGAGERLVEGPTRTGRSRVVDLDAGTVAALPAHRAARGLLTLDLVGDSALVLTDIDGTHRHPERFSRRFAGQVVRGLEALREKGLPVIRLRDLRHIYTILLLADRPAGGRPAVGLRNTPAPRRAAHGASSSGRWQCG